MVSRGLIAQWRQDITTADDAGDVATARRLRGELAAALAELDAQSLTAENDESGRPTGTKDKDYNLVRFVEISLANALRMEQYAYRVADDVVVSGSLGVGRGRRREAPMGTEVGDHLLARLREWGVEQVFGYPGDGIRPAMFGKVAVAAIVGNEDGAHKIAADTFQALDDIGFTIPAQGCTYWNGEAMGGIDYNDLPETPDAVREATRTLAHNAAHLAELLRAQNYPVD